jgi:ornithine cyclodeaminase
MIMRGWKMLYLSKQDTRKVVDLNSVLKTIEMVARAQAEGKVIWSEPGTCLLQIPQPRSRYRLKACALPEIPIAGIRIIGYPLGMSEGVDSTRFVLLSDPTTGKPLALIDDHWNYTLRTAASAVTGLRFLVSEGTASVALIGAGNLAYAMVLILNHVGLLGSLTVTSRRPDSREKFGRQAEEEFHIPVRVVGSVQEAVAGADLVVTATDANRQLVEDKWIGKGVTLCTLGRYELAPEIYRRADKIVVDSWDVAKGAPDVKSLVESGVLDKTLIHAQLHELITGSKKGREEAGETIVFRTDGLVSQDVAIAYTSYLMARERGVGVEL